MRRNGTSASSTVAAAVAAAFLGSAFPARAAAVRVDLAAGGAPVQMRGEIAYDSLGASAAVGDVNGDGLDDTVVAASVMNGGPPGAVYVVYQRRLQISPRVIDLATALPDLTIRGAHGDDALGLGIACGDVNGDGIDDIIFASTPYYEIYVVYGRRSFPPRLVIDLAARPPDITLLKEDPSYGIALAAEDLTGDGIDDILIGSPEDASPYGSGYGGVEVVYGSKRFPPLHRIDLDLTPPDAAVYGATPCDKFGGSVAAGDVNGDGVNDLIAGAVWARPGGRYECGTTYVVSGRRLLSSGVVDLSVSPADIEIWGEAGGWAFGNHFGWRVAAGDVNGDGLADVIASAPWASPTAGRANAGKVYVLFGNRGYPYNMILDLDRFAAHLTVHGRSAGDNLGYSLGCGNVSGDAVTDIVAGARAADPLGRADAGVVYSFFGRRRMPSPTLVDLNAVSADATIQGAEAGGQLGFASAVGRSTLPGRSAIVMGAPYAAPSGRVEGGASFTLYSIGR